MQSMHVDHIIPEHLLSNQGILEDILRDFGLPEDFDLNSYENWLPSCGPCNLRKSGDIFEPVPIVQVQLQRAAQKAGTARDLAKQAVSDAALNKSINTICRANEKTALTMEHVAPLVESLKKHSPELLQGIYEYVGSNHKDLLSLGGQRFRPAEIPLTPYHKIIMEDQWRIFVSTRYGTGYVPKGEFIHVSFYCGHCGSRGPWSGARCLSCGHLNDE